MNTFMLVHVSIVMVTIAAVDPLLRFPRMLIIERHVQE